MRQIAKLILNAVGFGNFTQRDELGNSKVIKSMNEYHQLDEDPHVESLNCDLIGNDQVEVHWKRKDEFVDASKKTNVAIAAFCTTYARLELYKALDTLGVQVCYMDTDSCTNIYVSYPGCHEIDLGELLGDWTDELLADNAEYMVGCFRCASTKNIWLPNAGGQGQGRISLLLEQGSC